MTESEWLACDDPVRMFDYLGQQQYNERRIRRFYRFASLGAKKVGNYRIILDQHWNHKYGFAWDQNDEKAKCSIIRDIFYNPFRPLPTITPSLLTWNDATIPKLAQQIYDERRFEDMPILADALIDAGCRDEEILSHCRSEGPHVKGCWVLDLLLGKS